MRYIFIFIRLFSPTARYTRMLFAELGFEEKTVNARSQVLCVLM